MPLRLLTLLLVGLFCYPSQAGNLAEVTISQTEQSILAAIDAHEEEAEALLKKVVNINSGSMNFVGVRKVGRTFQDRFADLGFDVHWVNGDPWGRAGHLIAQRGQRGVHFLMIGHLDTVFEADSPFQTFEPKSGSWVGGPGISDMKGGDVVILQTLGALQEAGVLDAMTVSVVLIGDEESSGRPLSLARADLKSIAEAADVALAFENGDDQPETVVIARRGYTGWQLDVVARPAHSSQIFKSDVGYGAIYETSRILNGFRVAMAGEQYLTFNPGIILGGTRVDYDAAHSLGEAFGKPNVIAEHARVSGDLRALTEDQRLRAMTRMREIVAEGLPHSSAHISFSEGYPPLAPTPGNRKLLELYSQVSQDLGYGSVSAVDPGSAGAADVSFTAGLVEMAIDGLGLLGKGAHTVEEQADIGLLKQQTKRAAVLMYRLNQQGGLIQD